VRLGEVNKRLKDPDMRLDKDRICAIIGGIKKEVMLCQGPARGAKLKLTEIQNNLVSVRERSISFCLWRQNP
jgi:hypothetical protein